MRYTKKAAIQNAKLDLKDKKILGILSDDSRTPFSGIAKKIGLSKDTVRYRIAKLEEAGVIQDYKTIIDLKKLGYESAHLFIQLSTQNEEVETKIMQKIKEQTFVRVIIKFSGRYDYEIAVAYKDINDLDDKISLIASICEGCLTTYDVLQLSKTYVYRAYPEDFIVQREQNKKPGKKEAYSPDDKDIIILDAISENATLPLYEIAAKAKLSSDAAKYRMRKMSDSGIIVKYTIGLDYACIGYQTQVILLQIPRLDGEIEQKAKELLKKSPSVVWAVKTIGKYNLMAYLCVKEVEDLHASLKELRKHLGQELKDYEIFSASEQSKYTYWAK